MKVKELIEELGKCNQDADVHVKTSQGYEPHIVEVDIGNPRSCAAEVLLIAAT